MDSEKNILQSCEELGLRLRQARIAQNKTQQELAVMAGVSAKLISRMENGDGAVSLAKWLVVSDIFGLLDTWREVLRIEEDPFEKYDREQKIISDLKKRRVRHRRR